MRSEDIEVMKKSWPKWKNMFDGEIYAAALSPSAQEEWLLQSLNIRYKILTIKDWDLNNERKEKFDIVVASNIFMYSNDPQLWFDNVLKSCKYFWIQDCNSGDRSPGGLGDDGDSARYKLEPEWPSTYDGAYDLNKFGDRLVEFVGFPVGPKSFHFVACIKGDIE